MRLVATSGPSALLWQTSDLTLAPKTLTGGTAFIGTAFTSDSTRVVSVDDLGTAGGTLYVHAVAGNGQAAVTAHVDAEPRLLAVSPRAAANGSVSVAVALVPGTAENFTLTASTLTVISALVLDTTRAAPGAVTFAPDGTVFAVGMGNRNVRFVGFTSLNPVGANIVFNADIKGLAYSPDGTEIAVAGGLGSPLLGLYDVAGHGLRAQRTPVYDTNAVAFSPDGKALLGGEADCGKVFVCAD
jgi:WD40 repeat protein